MLWENINFSTGKYGSLFVTHGKTAAARRMLPLTPRVQLMLRNRWEAANKPYEGWVWPAPTASSHIEPSTLKKPHAKVFKIIVDNLKDKEKPIRPFVLYVLRHTFLTRLGESGCDVWTLARIAGHSSIAMSNRYVHPGNDSVMDAMLKFGGHNFGHSETQTILEIDAGRLLSDSKDRMCVRTHPLQNVPETWFTTPVWINPDRSCRCHGRNGRSWKNACGLY